MQVVVGDVSLSYEVYGNGVRALVFLPALGTTTEMFRPQMHRFARDFTIIAVETGGHDPLGPVGTERSLEEYARYVIAAMDAVGLDDASLVGVSMGGMIAQEVALREADRVADLLLVSTVCTYPEEARSGLRARADAAQAGNMDQIAEASVQRWFTPGYIENDPEGVEFIRGIVASANPAAYAQAARAVSRVETCGRLKDVPASALVVRGAEDSSITQEAAESLAGALPSASLHVIEGASHLCNIERSDDFNRVLEQFLLDSEPDTEEQARYRPIAPW